MSFSDNLQYLRKKRGLTQEQFAEQLEVSRQAVSKWESAQSYPEMEKLLLMCELFDCSLDELVKGDMTQEDKEDSADYDRHMNRFSILIASAVSLILVAVALAASLDGILDENLVSIFMFILIGIAVSVLVVSGASHQYYRKRLSLIHI